MDRIARERNARVPACRGNASSRNCRAARKPAADKMRTIPSDFARQNGDGRKDRDERVAKLREFEFVDVKWIRSGRRRGIRRRKICWASRPGRLRFGSQHAARFGKQTRPIRKMFDHLERGDQIEGFGRERQSSGGGLRRSARESCVLRRRIDADGESERSPRPASRFHNRCRSRCRDTRLPAARRDGESVAGNVFRPKIVVDFAGNDPFARELVHRLRGSVADAAS